MNQHFFHQSGRRQSYDFFRSTLLLRATFRVFLDRLERFFPGILGVGWGGVGWGWNIMYLSYDYVLYHIILYTYILLHMIMHYIIYHPYYPCYP